MFFPPKSACLLSQNVTHFAYIYYESNRIRSFTRPFIYMLKAQRQVLLLGNGINRIDNPYSWEDLMNDLLKFAELEDAISVRNKPFPMLYEEMYLRWIASGNREEIKLKREIKRLLKQIPANDLHHEVMDLPVSDILTTNYDWNLESTLPGGIKSAPYIPPVKGSKYALLRRRQAGDKIVWHIHGEAYRPGTILLGYDPYSGYLAQIQSYMTKAVRYKDKDKETVLPPLRPRLDEGDDSIHCWIDHFFLSDIYILGLSMDFVEMHLWWIFHHRARLLANSGYHIRNRIYFLYPSVDQSWIKSRIDLLCACGVKCIPLPVVARNWKGAYESGLDLIRSGASNHGDLTD